MKALLRIIAVWLGLGAFALGLLLVHLATMGRRSPRALLASAILVAVTMVSGYASVQLWRLKNSGRLAGIASCVLGAAFVFAQFDALSLTMTDVVKACLTGVVLLVLISAPARRACGVTPDATEIE